MGQYSKYKLYIKEEYDGSDWSPVIPYEYYAEMIEEYSEDCGWIDYSKRYLTFVVKESGEILFSGSTQDNSTQNMIQYSLDSGTTWSSPSVLVDLVVEQGDVIYWKGNMIPNSYSVNGGIGTFDHKAWGEGMEPYMAVIDIEGNILSLLYGDSFDETTSIGNMNNTFVNLFKNVKVVDASKLSIPCSTLLNFSCWGMFDGCTYMTTPPQLPATTIGQYCYCMMFINCTSLETAPELPATTLSRNCYEEMFLGCSSLNYIKMLATDISAFNCFSDWVKGVAASGTFVKNSAMTDLPRGDSGIPNGWSVQDV